MSEREQRDPNLVSEGSTQKHYSGLSYRHNENRKYESVLFPLDLQTKWGCPEIVSSIRNLFPFLSRLCSVRTIGWN